MLTRTKGVRSAARPQPVIKWAGGKRQMLEQYRQYFPSTFGRYHEPFLGGAAVYFHLSPPVAVLSDSNDELINMYRMIQTKVDLLIEDLSRHWNNSEYYYLVREMKVKDLSDVQRASRFIFLNKTCFNGLYRVNRKGIFNVPFGNYKSPKIADVDTLLAANRALRKALLVRADFEVVLENARSGDFVYFDPPYFPVSQTANFTDFTNQPFGAAEQERLAIVFDKLARRGCNVMLSNSDTPYIRELFEGYRTGMVSLTANRSINSKGDRRGPVGELLVCSWMK